MEKQRQVDRAVADEKEVKMTTEDEKRADSPKMITQSSDDVDVVMVDDVARDDRNTEDVGMAKETNKTTGESSLPKPEPHVDPVSSDKVTDGAMRSTIQDTSQALHLETGQADEAETKLDEMDFELMFPDSSTKDDVPSSNHLELGLLSDLGGGVEGKIETMSHSPSKVIGVNDGAAIEKTASSRSNDGGNDGASKNESDTTVDSLFNGLESFDDVVTDKDHAGQDELLEIAPSNNAATGGDADTGTGATDTTTITTTRSTLHTSTAAMIDSIDLTMSGSNDANTTTSSNLNDNNNIENMSNILPDTMTSMTVPPNDFDPSSLPDDLLPPNRPTSTISSSTRPISTLMTITVTVAVVGKMELVLK